MNHLKRREIASATLDICARGGYSAPGGRWVDLAEAIAAACDQTYLVLPGTELSTSIGGHTPTRQVSAQTTLEAGAALVSRYAHVACLNFASAKNPGGGFLKGSQAQEESLARSSALYPTLQTQPEFYRFHRQQHNPLYSDRMIVSPLVPVFRSDSGDLLDEPWQTTFITAAAVNAGVVRRDQTGSTRHITATMLQRGQRVLEVAAQTGCTALVLGAWGCGVFQNDPREVAQIFDQLLRIPALSSPFQHIEFAIYDPSRTQTTLKIFEEVLA